MERQESLGSIESDIVPPDRSNSNSAPPALQLASESLFAWKVEYAKIFSDIRAHEDYVQFYESNKEKRELPPPLDPTFLFEFEEDERKHISDRHPSLYQSQDSFSELNQNFQGMRVGSNVAANKSVWNPISVQPAARKQSSLTDSFEDNLLLSRFQDRFDVSYSSSPSAQTALGAANYIWRDEDTTYGNTSYNNAPASINSTNNEVEKPTETPFFYNNGDYSSFSSTTTVNNVPTKMVNGSNLATTRQATVPPLVASAPIPTNSTNNSERSDSSDENSPRNSNVLCRYYAQGYCSRGDKCFYSHDATEATTIQAKSPDTSAVVSPSVTKPTTPTPPTVVTTATHVAHATPTNGGNTAAASNSKSNTPNTTPSKTANSGKASASNTPNKGNNSSKNTPNAKSNGHNNNHNNHHHHQQPTSANTTPPHSNHASRTVSPPPGLGASLSAQNNTSPISPRTQDFNFDTLVGRIYSVSKDQQGCRFLQKKLEEGNAQVVDVIFREVYDHIAELMIDPFGNYLCQKLLEHCNEEQRYLIVQRVAPELVYISKNMHGTRAVQKMIECLTSPPQVELIRRALCNSVVDLIQDLNGNHVIQRCLNRLTPDDNQFIYDAVTTGNNCVQVATHRHGCCVLQRCIDHAAKSQKVQLIKEIIKNGVTLIQDPYGNYVVQYVLDLPFPDLVDALARTFLGNLRILATQKFSSNVVEKCLQVIGPEVRHSYVKEILSEKQHFAQLLVDPFANYVIQTALTVSDATEHAELVEAIRPFMNQLRNTPYGKRIQSKITKDGPEKHHGKHR